MSNQFYPKLDKQAKEQKFSATYSETFESSPIPTTVTDSNLNRATQSKPITTGVNKNQLQIELAQNMQLQNIEANVLPDGLTPYKPITHQSIAYNSEQQQVIEPYQSSSSMELDVKSIDISSSINTTLASFNNTDSIRPKFKRYMAPEYPKNFWYNQIEQDVIATFKIQSNGRAYDISLSSQNNNFVAFEQAVEKAMKRWRFDVNSLNNSTLQRTYQQMFSFNISEEIMRNCDSITTGTRISKSMPCNK